MTVKCNIYSQNGAIAEYSPHSLVLQKTALTQIKKTLTLMSVNQKQQNNKKQKTD